MKTIFSVAVFISVCGLKTFSQDYTLDSAGIHAYGNPGDLFQASVHIQNNNGESSIVMHLERIVNNLPSGWAPSCFCFPECLAPFIDTLTFIIPPSGSDSINPNFPSDLIPGIGYITVILYQEGYASQADTLAFTGSTLDTGVNDAHENIAAIFPNPAGDFLEIIFPHFENNLDVTIYNIIGNKVLESTILSTPSLVNISSLPKGFYFLMLGKENKKITFVKL